MNTFAQAYAQANVFQRTDLYNKAKQFFDAATPEDRAKLDWEKVKETEVEYGNRIMPNSLSNDKQRSEAYQRYLDLLFQWCDSRDLKPNSISNTTS